MTTTLDWYGCATFAMKTAGMTIMLDAYIDRVPSAAGPRHADGRMYTADDVDECDWIVVGHSHFDHLWGTERIMPTPTPPSSPATSQFGSWRRRGSPPTG